MKKTALVTGASSGIGEATVLRLLKAGYVVYAAARRLDRMQALEAAGARLLAMDLTNDASMVAGADRVLAETGGVDVLVNNAGYGSYGALEDVPLDEARRQFEVNLFGAARLTQLLLPAMRARKAGKIVMVSSIGGKGGEPFGSWYHATKFALEGLSDSLRMELIPFGIDVIVIEPGAIRTEWGPIAHQSLLEMSGDTAYGPYARNHARMHERVGQSDMPSPPDVVARDIVRSVRARRAPIRVPSGGGARRFLFIGALLPDRMKDRLIWRMSQQG